nr:PREDICTED: signal-induced proliferation-associated 1-like protein 1 [Paralichthys olivaceus]
MQSDDLFIRKFRRQNVRPPIASVSFDPKREAGVVEWPPRRDGDGVDGDSLTPSRAGLNLRAVGRGHIMQRSNSDVTLGDLDSSGKAGGKATRVVGEKVVVGAQGDSGLLLHREYGSLSSLERQTQVQELSTDDQGPLSPSALRFKDPFLLLGLQGNPPEPDGFFRGLSVSIGDSPKPAKPPKPEGLGKKSKPGPLQIPQPGPYDNLGGGAWVRNFAHYDVQSILFDLTEAATNRDSIGRKKNITSGASAASQLRPLSQAAPSSPAQGGGGNGGNAEDPEQSLLLDEGDGNDNELLLSCPHFRNETGGEEQVGLGQSQGRRGLWLSLRTPNDAVSVLEEPRESHVQQQGKSNYFIGHADLGAHYYRKYFYMKEHQNFFGMDDRLGPVAISFRREEKEGSSGAQYNYRIIFRTTEMKTLRGSILEESVPSAARHTTPRGLSPKRLLEFIMPELNLHCLRLASNSPKVRDTLLKLDEQGLNFQRKVGVMYCRAGQSSEEDMYNNESSGPAFEEFLDLLGERVRLKGWEKYRAQLDNKTDSTGTHSLYTRYQDYEIMFHVSTMLPYTANNTQQQCGHVYDNAGLKPEHHINENLGELRDNTPDLILAVKPKVPLEDEQFMGAEFGDDRASASNSSLSSSRLSCVDRAERNSRALSLHNSITKILSETTDSTEEEWQSIANLATACRSILEALSREDRKAGDPSQAGADQTDGKLRDSKESDSPGHLEEKVSQLEAMLKKLQDDLQKEKEDKAVLQAEVQSLRQNNQRLQEESQSTVARLIKVTELLCNVNKPC